MGLSAAMTHEPPPYSEDLSLHGRQGHTATGCLPLSQGQQLCKGRESVSLTVSPGPGTGPVCNAELHNGVGAGKGGRGVWGGGWPSPGALAALPKHGGGCQPPEPLANFPTECEQWWVPGHAWPSRDPLLTLPLPAWHTLGALGGPVALPSETPSSTPNGERETWAGASAAPSWLEPDKPIRGLPTLASPFAKASGTTSPRSGSISAATQAPGDGGLPGGYRDQARPATSWLCDFGQLASPS